MAQKSYDQLLEHFKETACFQSMGSLLGWDQRTCIPPAGNVYRATQMATLAGFLSRRLSDPKLGEMLAAVESSSLVADPLSDEAVNVREWRRAHDRACKIPESLAKALSQAASEGETAWETARPANDWNGFLPFLERIIDLKREEARALEIGAEPYDGLIQDFEPGESARNIQALFAELSGPLTDLLQRIRESGKKPDAGILSGNSPISAQNSLIREITQRIGFSFDWGRMDKSAHPFTAAIGLGDVRITTRYDENSFVSALFSAIHETGHALYEQGLPPEHWGTPRGTPVSMAIHESQSRLWENMVARSAGFWSFFYPTARECFPWLEGVSIEDFHLAINEVSPSLIRTEADEVTYNLHIIMRFELELALIRKEIEARDLPDAWNARMQAYFGLTPPDHTTGVLQDVHWSGGSFGYFPSYALGNMYAAQFYAKAKGDLGDPEVLFAGGIFAPFLSWLSAEIHQQGSRYLPRDLVRAVTGEELRPKYLIDYLYNKYANLYNI